MLAIILAAISVGIAAASAWRQVQQARIANALPTAIDLFREFRLKTPARHRIPERLAGFDKKTPLTQLDGDVFDVAHLVETSAFSLPKDSSHRSSSLHGDVDP